MIYIYIALLSLANAVVWVSLRRERKLERPQVIVFKGRL